MNSRQESATIYLWKGSKADKVYYRFVSRVVGCRNWGTLVRDYDQSLKPVSMTSKGITAFLSGGNLEQVCHHEGWHLGWRLC